MESNAGRHVPNAFLSRPELIWPISRLKISILSKNAFLAKSFRSHFNYCSPLLIEISQTQSDKLENANYFVLRTILNLLQWWTKFLGTLV